MWSCCKVARNLEPALGVTICLWPLGPLKMLSYSLSAVAGLPGGPSPREAVEEVLWVSSVRQMKHSARPWVTQGGGLGQRKL